MKNLIYIFILFPVIAFAQSNFLLKENRLIWQKVYEEKATPELFKNHLLQNLEFGYIEVMDDKIIATINNLKIDYKGYGTSELFTSMYIARNNYDALAIIEFKENRYRITIKDIMAIADYSDGLTEQGEKTQLERFATNRKGFKKRFIEKDALIFDYTFNKLFKPKQQSDNDW